MTAHARWFGHLQDHEVAGPRHSPIVRNAKPAPDLNGPLIRPDELLMDALAITGFDALALLAAGAAVFAMLYALAARLGFDIELHKLRVDTMTLRCKYEERIAQIRAMGGDMPEGTKH